ncbi:MAG: peptidase [Treponema sp.]|jgi:hypothetical protein|nr:peptidase [Treponema sp.]
MKRSKFEFNAGAKLGVFFLLTGFFLFRNFSASPAEQKDTDSLPDPYRPDLTINALAVQEGFWYSGTLQEGDQNWFSFTPAGSGIMSAETAGAVDTALELFSGISKIGENDDMAEGNHNARIEYYTEQGIIYTFRVSGYHGAAGPYRFRVTMESLQAGRGEPNDTQSQALLIRVNSQGSTGGNRLTAYFHSPGDVDWYTFRVPRKSILIFGTEGSLDTVIELYDSRGNLVAEADDSGKKQNAGLAMMISPDTYFVKVVEFNQRLGKYYLYIRFKEPRKPDRYENDDELKAARDILIGTPQRRNFTGQDDIDWARLRITQEGIYVIEAAGSAEAGASLDLAVGLFDQDGNEIAFNDDGGKNLGALLTVSLVPGLYYIKVSASFEEFDETAYSLKVDRREE